MDELHLTDVVSINKYNLQRKIELSSKNNHTTPKIWIIIRGK